MGLEMRLGLEFPKTFSSFRPDEFDGRYFLQDPLKVHLDDLPKKKKTCIECPNHMWIEYKENRLLSVPPC